MLRLMCTIFLMLSPLLSAQQPKKELVTKKIFLEVKQTWVKGNARKLQTLLAKKVSLNLGKRKGRFSKEQATAVLQAYFRSIKVLEFKYYAKKMKLKKASAVYCYKSKTSGKRRQKIIYIFVLKNPKTGKWLIHSIKLIG